VFNDTSGMAENGFWIDEPIYWTLLYTDRDCISHTHTHISVRSNVFTAVPWYCLSTAGVPLLLVPAMSLRLRVSNS
jgi:hypothetical protein